MIPDLKIINFQSHKRTVMKFSPGVNVIVGPTDSGKSAVLRALRWLMNNKPLGESFRSWWGGDTTVAIGLDSDGGRRVRRVRGKQGNLYKLEDFEASGGNDEFKAMDKSVPDEIKDALNILPVNLEAQMEPSYMLSLSAGEAAKQLNDAAGLDVIDRVTTWLKAEKRTTSSQLQSEQAQLERQKEELKGFAHVPELEGRVSALEAVAGQISGAEAKETTLAALLADIAEADEVQHHYSYAPKALVIVEAGLVEADKVDGMRKRAGGLETLLDDIIETRDDIESLAKTILELEQRWKLDMPNVCPLCGEQKVKE